MLASLAANVVLVADGGSRPGALLRPVEGAEPVARVMLNAIRRHGVEGADIRPAMVNGLPGFVRFHEDGHAQVVLAFGVMDGRIHAVFVIGNPDKLRHLHQSTRRSPTNG